MCQVESLQGSHFEGPAGNDKVFYCRYSWFRIISALSAAGVLARVETRARIM